MTIAPSPPTGRRRVVGLLTVAIAALVPGWPAPSRADDATTARARRAARSGHLNAATTPQAPARPAPSAPPAVSLDPAGKPIPTTEPLQLADGLVEQPIWLDTGRVAEFGDTPADSASVLREATRGEVSADAVGKALRDGRRGITDSRSTDSRSTNGAIKGRKDSGGDAGPDTAGAAPTTTTAAVSPVFVDASGRARALPGGVIVTLKADQDAGAAEAELAAAGLVPRRQLSARSWLVEAPAGIGSLALANRLQAEGRFARVQPNWWVDRSKK